MVGWSYTLVACRQSHDGSEWLLLQQNWSELYHSAITGGKVPSKTELVSKCTDTYFYNNIIIYRGSYQL